MTVKDLKALLAKYPEDTEIITVRNKDTSPYVMIENRLYLQNIKLRVEGTTKKLEIKVY